MTAGHHDIIGDAEMLGSKVTQWGWDQSQVGDMAAGFKEALCECLG